MAPANVEMVQSEDCEKTHKSLHRLLSVMFTLMALVIGMVGYAIAAGNSAADLSADVATQMQVHEAKQNGSLGKIDSQLNTLRQYHSTLRGEMKEQRLLLDELLRHAGDHIAATEGS